MGGQCGRGVVLAQWLAQRLGLVQRQGRLASALAGCGRDMSAMRWLKIAVIVMGVLIVGGTVTLMVLIIQRAGGSSSGTGSVNRPAVPGSVALTGLGEPEGTRIVSMATSGERIVLHLQGGGTDRLALLDSRTLQLVGRVSLGR